MYPDILPVQIVYSGNVISPNSLQWKFYPSKQFVTLCNQKCPKSLNEMNINIFTKFLPTPGLLTAYPNGGVTSLCICP